MSDHRSYLIRVYRRKGRRTLVGQILEVASGRKSSFATISELTSAFFRMLRFGDPKEKEPGGKKRGRRR